MKQQEIKRKELKLFKIGMTLYIVIKRIPTNYIKAMNAVFYNYYNTVIYSYRL